MDNEVTKFYQRKPDEQKLEEKNPDEKLYMVVVMGVTGAGKSYFINKLAGREVTKEGGSLHACTQGCALIPVEIGGSKVCMIDTPGFDEAKRSDSEILTEIARLLAAQYQLGVELKGVIYVHRITDIRYTGSAVRSFEICKKICGDSPLKNVLLVTSRWSDVDEETGSQREGELRENFWAYMLNKGSNMSRFHGDRGSAVVLLSQLLAKDSTVLDLQRQLVDERMELKDTTAGSYVNDNLEDLKAQYQKELLSLEKLRQDLLEEDRAMKRRIQQDMAKEKARLKGTQEQQVSLKRNIGKEVREEIQKKTSVVRKLLPFVPAVIDILGIFVGIPPGAFTGLTLWAAKALN